MKTRKNHHIYYGNTPQKTNVDVVQGEYVPFLDENYYCIRNYDSLEPFFMTLVSSSDHWLFISTTGGLTAGRIDSAHALFPYYTVDKITENSENTGRKTILLVATDRGQMLWEPFSNRNVGIYQIQRNLYKNISGTSIVFEEVNHDLKLTYRYAWRTSETYGFVKTTYLINNSNLDCHVRLLDGLQNILPAHINVDIQNTYSNLLDAYKFSELDADTGLAMYALSSRLTDLAEPSESLRANVVWQVGLDNITYLLSSVQLDAFRNGADVTQEEYMRAKRGAYFVYTELVLRPDSDRVWHQVAEVEQDSSEVVALLNMLKSEKNNLFNLVEQDIKSSQKKLDSIVAQADGKQVSSDELSTGHHFANVLFNVMRGGIFANHYEIDLADLKRYISVHKPASLVSYATFFESLPDSFSVAEFDDILEEIKDSDISRLLYSYLPLTFSRRHGDPSRPWNRFQINVTQADGSRRLDFQGNWRDIFQNWEALSYSYPEFIHGMISMFLNATTADGYNPYRVTRDGIDWEVPEPDNPWANIGYWNDHQIIYLEKLLEVCNRFKPGTLDTLLNRRIFSYANVPYQIKRYDDLTKNPYKTIDFDWDKEEQIRKLVSEIGADGKLVHDASGNVVYGSLTEKLLLLLLTKLSNFVPEGGIWLNTQRPEWNDANNALVGKGLSVVTLGYIRRYIAFFLDLLKNSDTEQLTISSELATFFTAIEVTFAEYKSVLNGQISDAERRTIMGKLGVAGSDYRWQFYENGLSTDSKELVKTDVIAFLEIAQAYVEHSLRANKRDDNLYHAYNVLHLSDGVASIKYLPVMLEGQVSILSSGMLSADKTLRLMQSMRESDLYRAEQHSYMLYPDRELPGFLDKNTLSADAVRESKLITSMQQNNDRRLVSQDVNGNYHFSSDIRKADDIADILATLESESDYGELAQAEKQDILDLFEQVFNHAAFTGRSGTFFAYEGLGSIYWHMISKLLLAVQESVLDAKQSGASQTIVDALLECYDDVRAGLGFNKSPSVYGAFPTDPYSHTPMGSGAKQPGMTGMVKEEILTRLVEMGIVIENGSITYEPITFRKQELLETPSTLEFVNLDGETQQLEVPANALAFTICQIPIIVKQDDSIGFEVVYRDNRVEQVDNVSLGVDISREIFARTGNIKQITLFIN